MLISGSNLILSDSVARDLPAYMPNQDCDVLALPGFTINRLEKFISQNPRLLQDRKSVLLHIGTNDMIHSEGSDPGSVEAILDEIDAWEAANGIEVFVYVARIINQQPYSAITTEYNDNVEAMVALRGDPTILMVDMENGANIVYGTDLQSDGIHVEESGYDKMAQVWFDTLDYYLSSIPEAPTGLSASTVDAGSIQLSWTENSANETGYRVERSLSSGSGFFQIALLDLIFS